ncbi:golgi uridine diphosphate-N- acetylglucosamine transporter [Coemansia sp. RSA 2706]|nr:golgi uridine diphosphate-N- acetylglucosamine transporter [Coemansia sp. RSA 2706]KAJ2314646.1 golgi uridine diphosphate-N- acetylglucosamine transporter [Coemansia sp. RSA 2705]KAJ2739640.1 golgi uridine diphosphate-N- acetylglucosamine transporter [Coemansia sp. Cherry 401B]
MGMLGSQRVGAVAAVLLSEWVPVLGLIFGGCCTNVFALESLVRSVPKSGNLITFAQFFFITLVTLPSQLTSSGGLRARQVPVRRWLTMVVLYFCVSVLNNLALGHKVSIPLHIVFRSSGLIANMACGRVVMGKRYGRGQAASVVVVSVGVVVATLASVSDEGAFVGESLVGVGLLALGVVFAALLGLYQEQTYAAYGKHWQEGLFYNHVLALPMFAFFYRDIWAQMRALTRESARVQVPGVGALHVQSLWAALLVNVVSQWACASGVHRMTSMSTSLTLNVVLNVRKLVSLVLSVVLFRNPVTPGMVGGCLLVFAGTFAYSRFSRAPTATVSKKRD